MIVALGFSQNEEIPMSRWQASCDDPSHPLWEGPIRTDWDFVQGDKTQHDGSRHANDDVAIVTELEEE
jgi:hypothetical protein